MASALIKYKEKKTIISYSVTVHVTSGNFQHLLGASKGLCVRTCGRVKECHESIYVRTLIAYMLFVKTRSRADK